MNAAPSRSSQPPGIGTIPTNLDKDHRKLLQSIKENIAFLQQGMAAAAAATSRQGTLGLVRRPIDEIQNRLDEIEQNPPASADDVAPTPVLDLALSVRLISSNLLVIGALSATWTASTHPSGIVNYEYEFWITGEESKTTSMLTSLVGFDLFPAQIGAEYNVRVRSYYRAARSDWSAVVKATVVGDSTGPNAPTSVTATGGLGKVAVTWVNPTADYLQVTIHRGSTAGFTADASNRIGTIRGTGWIDNDVVAGTNYYYKIIAYDVAGNPSAASAAAGPATPIRLDIGNIGQYMLPDTITQTQLAAQSVLAKHLYVGDLENLCYNGMGDSIGNWNADGIGTDSPFPHWASFGVISNSALTFRARDNYFGAPFAVKPGEGYYVYADTIPGSFGPSTYSFSVGLFFMTATGAPLNWLAGATRTAGASSYGALSGSLSVPAGAATARVWVQIDGPGGVIYSGPLDHWHATHIQVRRRNNGLLIVDGTIRTNHFIVDDLDGNIIKGNTLHGNKVIANTITGNEIVGTTLSAITADLGTVTAGALYSVLFRSGSSGPPWVGIDSSNGLFGQQAGGAFGFNLRIDGSGYLGTDPGVIRWSAAGAVTVDGTLTGSGLISGPAFRSTGPFGRRIDIDASNEFTYKDSGGVVIASIGLIPGGSILDNVATFGSVGSGNEASTKIGLVAYSYTKSALRAASFSTSENESTIESQNLNGGVAIRAQAGTGIGFLAFSRYGAELRANDDTAGAPLVVAENGIRSMPVHTAKTGSVICVDHDNDSNHRTSMVYQRRNDGSGFGDEWSFF